MRVQLITQTFCGSLYPVITVNIPAYSNLWMSNKVTVVNYSMYINEEDHLEMCKNT